VSVNEGKNFVEVKELQNAHRQNSKTVKDINSNYLEIKDFEFLFGKESSNPNPPTPMDYKIRIKNALAALESALIEVYFEEMNAVVEEYASKITTTDKYALARFERRFMHGEKDSEFAEQLKLFAKKLRDYLMKQE
jgi:hypothetical protein